MVSEIHHPVSPAFPGPWKSIGETLPPGCAFVTGPRPDDVARWLRQSLRRFSADRSDVRAAVLLAGDGSSGNERLAPPSAAVAVRKVFVPCLCCPWLAELPGAAQALVATTGAHRLFVVVPMIAASALLAEFDRDLGWPRRVVVCLDEKWATACRQERLSPFQASLLGLADTIVTAPARGARAPQSWAAGAGRSAPIPLLILS